MRSGGSCGFNLAAIRPLVPQRDAAQLSAVASLRRPRQRAVDHVDGVLQAVHRDERAEARAFLLAKQHLVEHIEPVERDAGLAVLGLLLLIEERRTTADIV